ncbi:MAG TPA: RNA-directed DNA polymerase [Pirellulales bacterium]|jgi:hypothetical protein
MSKSRPADLFSDEDLYLAYRKAKADLFYERSIPNAKRFAIYEENLQGNLQKLQKRLRTGTARPWYADRDFIGGVTFVPKKLTLPADDKDGPKFFASNAESNWNRIFDAASSDTTQLVAEFRPMADFSVDMHIVCALWINHVGEKLDACLSDAALGARLRRIAGTKAYHRTIWQSFSPYFQSYKKWRDGGFAAIRRELHDGKAVVALTMDFTRFFHKVDPRFLLNKKFLTLISKSDDGKPALSKAHKAFTESLVTSFETWGGAVPGYVAGTPVGVPVGATASRVIANVLLLEFDRRIQKALTPIYYARYVDDIFLVLRDTGDFANGREVLDWIVERADGLIEQDGKRLTVSLPYAQSSEIEFQADKQCVFLIDNADLLDAIKSKVDEVTSEWRLLPDLKQMEKSAAARVLTTSKDGNSDGDALRKTDTLLLKRLGFAILLRNLDAIADALPPAEWKSEREDFYEFAKRHIIAPGKLFELADYLPRLVSIAVYCGDWKYAHQFVATVIDLFGEIREHAVLKYMNAPQNAPTADRIWEGVFRHLHLAFEEALLKSCGLQRKSECRKLYTRIASDVFGSDDFTAEVIDVARKLFCRDLGRNPFKAHLLKESAEKITFASELPSDLPPSLDKQQKGITKLLEEVDLKDTPTMPILFPTRPLGPADISILIPNSAADINKLKNALNSVRGTFYTDSSSSPKAGSRVVKIGHGSGKQPPRIAVTSLLTEWKSWHAAAGQEPDVSAERFERLYDLCTAILKAPKNARPRYVLFPELSIPKQWMRTVAEGFLRSGISVIAGEEYTHHGTGRRPRVDSAARLFLTDNRLGYPSWCALTQLKGKASHHERDELRQKFGIELRPSDANLAVKFVFNHFGFRFGLLICSELTDMQHRLRFRGKIDSLFVLSWNQDLESFSALVDASALDIHCFVALVNNRMFGDSRVRVPHINSWARDEVRVKGGLADYFVVAELDIHALRDFQSQVEPPEKPFKPFPEGFEISRSRRVIPGT